MLNAWGQFGGRRKLGLSVLASTVLYAALVGCDPLTVMEESDPSKLSVMYTGCHTVQEGPLCELPKLNAAEKTASLTLHVALQDIPTIVIRSSKGETTWNHTKCSTETCIKTDSGHRITLPLLASTQEVLVKSPSPDISDWALSITDYQERPAAMSDAVALERTSKREEALHLLETALPTLAPQWQAEAMSHVARMYKRLGKADEALQSFEQSMDLHLQTGGLSHYVKDGTAAVHTLIMDAGMKLNEARDLAASLRGILPQHYESQHFYHWASMFAAHSTRTHDDVLLHSQRGMKLGKKIGNAKLENFFTHLRSLTLQKVGRFDEAIELLQGQLVRSEADESRDCSYVENLNTLGFIQWHKELVALDDQDLAPTAVKTFHKAAELAIQLCTSGVFKHERTNSYINLALAYMSLGRLDDAASWLQRINISTENLLLHQQWYYQTKGEILLERGLPHDALAAFDKIAQLRDHKRDPYVKLRSQLGQIDANLQLKKHTEALTIWDEHISKIDEEGLLVPIHSGRELFLSQYATYTESLVSTLLKDDQIESARKVIQQTQSQLLRSVVTQDRLNFMTSSEKLAWLAALGQYETLRSDLEGLRKNLWTIPTTEKPAYEAQINKLENQVLVALDRVHDNLKLVSRSARDDQQSSVEEGVAQLTFSQTRSMWVLIVSLNNQFTAITQPRKRFPKSNQVAKALIKEAWPHLREANQLAISASGLFSNLDFHQIEIHSQPLIAHFPIRYSFGLSNLTEPKAHGSKQDVLILGDPSGNLPNARIEAEAVFAILSANQEQRVKLSVGSDITPTNFKASVQGTRLFHYAGHGRFDQDVPVKSELILSNESKFDVGDILSLTSAPETVILSACQTATTDTLKIYESLGLAHAFIAAGSKQVIASSRNVRDDLSYFIMNELHQKYLETKDLARSLQFAQITAAQRFPESDWATYRLITRN